MPLTQPRSQDGWNEDELSDRVWHETRRRGIRKELDWIDWDELTAPLQECQGSAGLRGRARGAARAGFRRCTDAAV
ncbi:Uncharacterized protein DAT39_005699 [Clarias magur]|uniref:Uncharacterized protein n=1 Tax=Clarias magur TaxID=1594786 RepID=A0A8J4TVI6_CLAMG|nr:Uncharacterized protein DAT39_005699 [Clarias magur]